MSSSLEVPTAAEDDSESSLTGDEPRPLSSPVVLYQKIGVSKKFSRIPMTFYFWDPLRNPLQWLGTSTKETKQSHPLIDKWSVHQENHLLKLEVIQSR